MGKEKVNKGTLLLNSDIRSETKTVIVTGIPRSGTSMAAKVMAELGIYMGASATAPIYEDAAFTRLLNAPELDELAFKQRIKQMNQSFNVWGWKTPGSFLKHNAIRKFIRNPHYVIPIRDPLAIALRNNLAISAKAEQNLLHTFEKQYNPLMNFISKVKKPTLLFSYEKALNDKQHFVKELASFCGLDKESYDVNEILNAIQPNNKDYIKLTSKVYDGHLDSCTNGIVKGWAKIMDKVDACKIDIYIGDTLVKSKIKANLHRNDLETAGIGSGKHGFAVDINDELNNTSEIEIKIRVKICETDYSLHNSPLTIKT